MVATKVMYRFDRHGQQRECTAIFPTFEANPGRRVCYAHLGQHGEADIGWIRQRTRPATPAEYAALHRELTQIYGPLRVVKRS